MPGQIWLLRLYLHLWPIEFLVETTLGRIDGIRFFCQEPDLGHG